MVAAAKENTSTAAVPTSAFVELCRDDLSTVLKITSVRYPSDLRVGWVKGFEPSIAGTTTWSLNH